MINLLFFVLALVVLLLAFPVGYLIAYLCRDEIVYSRKVLVALSIVSFTVIIVIASIKLNSQLKYAIIFALLFIITVSKISVWKGHDKKFINKK